MGRVQETSSRITSRCGWRFLWPAWLSVVLGHGRELRQNIGLDVGGIPPSWLQFWLERSPSVATWLAFGSKCPGILSSPVRRWRPQRSAIGVALTVEAPLLLLLGGRCAFGGFGIPIYSLCLAAAVAKTTILPARSVTRHRARASVAQQDRDRPLRPNSEQLQ